MKRAKNKSLKVSENQFGVLLENMDSKIDLVLEQYSFLGKKIDDVRLELKTELLSFKSETKNNFKSIFEYLRTYAFDQKNILQCHSRESGNPVKFGILDSASSAE